MERVFRNLLVSLKFIKEWKFLENQNYVMVLQLTQLGKGLTMQLIGVELCYFQIIKHDHTLPSLLDIIGS